MKAALFCIAAGIFLNNSYSNDSLAMGIIGILMFSCAVHASFNDDKK